MLVMEVKSQNKEKVTEINKEVPSSRLLRPKSFSLKRRDAVYFFSGDSPRGILKSVPIRNGSYRTDELLTVVDKPDVTEISTEILSDVPLNGSETSEADKNNTATGKDDTYQSAPQNKKKKNDSKLLDEADRSELWSKALKKLSILEAYNESLKTKIDGKKPLKDINQNEDVLYRSIEALKKKRQTSKDFEETNSKNLKVCLLDKLYEKTLVSNRKSDPLKNPGCGKDNKGILSKTWTEGFLSNALCRMSIKPPITEL